MRRLARRVSIVNTTRPIEQASSRERPAFPKANIVFASVRTPTPPPPFNAQPHRLCDFAFRPARPVARRARLQGRNLFAEQVRRHLAPMRPQAMLPDVDALPGPERGATPGHGN